MQSERTAQANFHEMSSVFPGLFEFTEAPALDTFRECRYRTTESIGERFWSRIYF